MRSPARLRFTLDGATLYAFIVSGASFQLANPTGKLEAYPTMPDAKPIDRPGTDNDQFVVRSYATRDNWTTHDWHTRRNKSVGIPDWPAKGTVTP